MKINKACDLSSISVLPPQSRRRSGVSCSLPEMSSMLKLSQAQSQQQQRSQQSVSQGISSQHNISQFSQNSQDDTLTNDQLIVSQERENSVRRFSFLPPVNHTRDESQMLTSRSSTALIRKWGPGVSEQRTGQMSEEFERRIGTIESSLSRFGLMMESLQTDIMQINKGTKELTMDMESIRQKLNAQDNSLQIINKGQEDVKSSLQGELKLISDQLNQKSCHQNSQDISILLSNLQEKVGFFISNLRNDLYSSFTNEMQALGCKLKALDQNNPTPTVPPSKAVSFCVNPQGIAPQKNLQVPPKVQLGTQIPKVEMGTWNSVKREKVTLANKYYSRGHNHNSVSHTEPERELRVVIESDEDIEGGFTFFSEEKETDVGRYSIEKAKEETARILRKARRRKRKQCNTIIIS